ncbi:NAD-dependent epimerase/dehydratase family protein, partial [Candidatus Aerophobetes bacterium]
MILVTGCCGFIGSHLTERLLKEGEDVLGIDNFDPYYPRQLKMRNLKILRDYKKFQFVEESILGDLKHLFQGVSLVYHQAAIAGVRNSLRDPLRYIKNNLLGTTNILNLSRNSGVKRVIFASSSSVYGEVGESELPIEESRKLEPISPYGYSKKLCEEICQMYSRIWGLEVVSLRYFTVYGPRQRPDEAFSKFIKKMLKGERLEIYGSGEQTRDFTYVSDAVEATLLAAKRGQGVYNIASGSRISLNKALSLISRVSGLDPKIVRREKQPGDVTHTWASISKAKKELGY